MGLVECIEGKPTQAYVAAGKWQPVRRQAGTRQLAIQHLILAPFLPEGYPHSVTADFPGVVRWHVVQALSSYIRGILASHAVFLGLGVGNQAASALSAVFGFFLRDVVGLAGGILFASAAGGNFDANAKQWRLFADVLNNMALALDLGSPLVPGAFLLLASAGSIARAAVGMAGGATHTALTQHFAIANNAAEVSAKADARERACNIVGSLVGMALTHCLADHVGAAWLVFLVLTLVHVWANVRALRCLQLTSLNEARLLLLVEHYATTGRVLTPAEVSQQETLLIPPVRRALLALTGHQALRVDWGCSLARLPVDLQRAVYHMTTDGIHRPEGLTKAPTSADTDSTGLRRRHTSKQQQQRPSTPSEIDQFVVVAGGGASSRQLALLHVQGKVVQVVLQEGMQGAQQLRVYVSALLAALQGRQALSSPAPAPPNPAAASPATRARTRQQQQQAAEDMGGQSQAGAALEQQSQQLLAALQVAGWQLQGAYLPRPARTVDW